MPSHDRAASAAHGLFFFLLGSGFLFFLKLVDFDGANENKDEENLSEGLLTITVTAKRMQYATPVQ